MSPDPWEALNLAAAVGESFFRLKRDPVSGTVTGLEWLDPSSVTCNPDGSYTVNRDG